jgi:hypothetical protein
LKIEPGNLGLSLNKKATFSILTKVIINLKENDFSSKKS